MSRSFKIKQFSHFSLDGKIAVVTGAGRGIGRAIAMAFAEAGADVRAVARTESDLLELVQESEGAAGAITPWIADVTSDAFIRDVRHLSSLDILVNNAGTNKLQLLEDIDDETLDMLLDLNVRSLFRVSRAAALRMREVGKGGSIIHMSSQMGHVGAVKRAIYCMTKHAVEGLTKAMAIELAPEGIRVNAVAPTIVETSMTAPFLKDPAYQKFARDTIPMGSVALPEDVAGAALYLASPQARLVTGTSLKVDGGATAA